MRLRVPSGWFISESVPLKLTEVAPWSHKVYFHWINWSTINMWNTWDYPIRRKFCKSSAVLYKPDVADSHKRAVLNCACTYRSRKKYNEDGGISPKRDAANLFHIIKKENTAWIFALFIYSSLDMHVFGFLC